MAMGRTAQLRAMLRAFLAMDLRNPSYARATGSGPKDLIPPLFWVIGQHLLIGLSAAFVLFTRVDAGFFALCHLTLGMLALVSAMAVELNEVVANPDDRCVLGPLPVRRGTIALARLFNLGLYLTVIALSLFLVPAIVGCGLRDAGWRWLPAFALSALAASLLSSGVAVLLLAVALRHRLAERLRDALAWTQILLILVLVYGGQALLRDAEHRLQLFAADLPSWVAWTPPGMLARFASDACADEAAPDWWAPLGGVALGLVLWLVAWRRLSAVGAAGAASEPAELPALARPGRLGGRLAGLVGGDVWGRLGFWFTCTMLARDGQVRLRALPALSMPLAPLLLGAFWHRLGDPLVPGGDANLTLAAVYLVALPMPAAIGALQGSRHAAAAWILASAPLPGRDRLLRGQLRAVSLLVALPMLAVLTGVLAWNWGDLLDPLLLAVAAGATAHLAGAVAIRLLGRRLPGSRPFSRGEALGPMASAGAAMAVVAGCLALLQATLVHDRAAMLLFGAALVAIAWAGERLLLPGRRA